MKRNSNWSSGHDIDNEVYYQMTVENKSIEIFKCTGGCVVNFSHPYSVLTINCDTNEAQIFVNCVLDLLHYDIEQFNRFMSALHMTYHEINFMYEGVEI